MEILRNHPEGLWVNAIVAKAAKLKIAARATVINDLKALVLEGMVVKTPEDWRQGQKIFYSLSEERTKLNKCLDDLDKLHMQICDTLDAFHFTLYKELIKDDEEINGFFRYFHDHLSTVFIEAEYKSRPFPDAFQEPLFKRAFTIIRDLSMRFSAIIREQIPDKLLSFDLAFPRVFYMLNEYQEEFDDWLRARQETNQT